MLILPESIQTLINAFVAIFAKKEELKQPDWNQSDSTKLDYIKNKPSIPSIDGLASTTYVDNAIEGLGSAAFTETTDYMLAGQVIDGGAW